MPVGPELKELLEKCVSAVIDGVKRIEAESPYWSVEVYRLKTTIRVDIKEVNRVKGGQ